MSARSNALIASSMSRWGSVLPGVSASGGRAGSANTKTTSGRSAGVAASRMRRMSWEIGFIGYLYFYFNFG